MTTADMTTTAAIILFIIWAFYLTSVTFLRLGYKIGIEKERRDNFIARQQSSTADKGWMKKFLR